MSSFPQAAHPGPARLGVFAAPEISYADFLADKWLVICRELGLNCSETTAAIDEIRDLLRPWGDRPIGTTAAVPSFVSEDGFPAEFSLSWRRQHPEIRILFESLGAGPSAVDSQRAGQALMDRLRERDEVSIEPYLKIEDLFVVPDPEPNRPTVWHSLACPPGGSFRYKVYLNPQAHGADRAFEVTGEAMSRLGLSAAWQPVEERGRELAARGHELEFFALDLSAAPGARAKVYFRHSPMPMSELDTVASFARAHDPVRAAEVRKMIYGPDVDEVHNEPMTCLAFRADSDTAEEANLYLRLPDNAESDAESTDRIAAVLESEGIDPTGFRAAISALVPEPKDTVGLQELLSYRTIAPGQPADVGVYLRFSTYDRPVTG